MLAAGAFALTMGPATTALAKVEGDTIILGSAISLTGKYATNGLHTQRGYDYAASHQRGWRRKGRWQKL